MFACKSVTVIVEYMECSNCERNTKNVEWRAAWNVFVCGLIFQLFFSPEYYSHCRCIKVPWNYKINKLPQILDSWMAVLKLSLKFSPIFHWISQFFFCEEVIMWQASIKWRLSASGHRDMVRYYWFQLHFADRMNKVCCEIHIKTTRLRESSISSVFNEFQMVLSNDIDWNEIIIWFYLKHVFFDSVAFRKHSIDEFIIHSQVLWSDSIDVHSLKLSSKYLNYNRFKRIRFAI